MNLQQHKDLKLAQMVYMENIILDPKMMFSQVLSKVSVWNFSVFFLHEHTATEKFKTEQSNFLAKLCFEVFCAKVAQNWRKMRVSKFCDKSIHWSFLIFWMKLQQHNGQKMIKLIFSKKICFGVFGQKWLKMSFVSFMTTWLI